MDRRDLFKILSVAAVPAAAQHHHAPSAAAPHALKFLSPSQDFLVDRLADIIIPSDPHSPGAHDAKVSHYIDLILHYGNDDLRATWNTGFAAVEAECKKRFNKTFQDCSRQQHEQLLAAMAEREGARTGELGKFFARIKALTIAGYHYSEVGLRQDMGYKGNTAVAAFPGCTHPGHQK